MAAPAALAVAAAAMAPAPSHVESAGRQPGRQAAGTHASTSAHARTHARTHAGMRRRQDTADGGSTKEPARAPQRREFAKYRAAPSFSFCCRMSSTAALPMASRHSPSSRWSFSDSIRLTTPSSWCSASSTKGGGGGLSGNGFPAPSRSSRPPSLMYFRIAASAGPTEPPLCIMLAMKGFWSAASAIIFRLRSCTLGSPEPDEAAPAPPARAPPPDEWPAVEKQRRQSRARPRETRAADRSMARTGGSAVRFGALGLEPK
mmetsp:Transcript_7730/g.24566  ORF Transcript_7730/g.24566 Transcript_7730/m.24566 type:complete len:260 (-) Transcript_7730:2-781(-)